MRHPDMPFADTNSKDTLVTDGEARQTLESWQNKNEPSMTLRVWLSTTNVASARLEWGKNTDARDEAMALAGAHQMIDDLLIKLRQLASVLADAGGDRGES